MNTSFVRAALAAFALSSLAACGGGGGGVSGSSAGAGSPDSRCTTRSAATDQYMKADSSTKTVSLVLDITGFSYDGFSNGQMTVCVPQGWKVTAQCTNKTTVPHSCAVVENATATSPAFSGATTKDPVTGLQPGESESFTFSPDRTGQFRIVCLVPGHEDAGMWDYFNVTSTGDPLIVSSGA
jgi:Sulfocyanin (SoxE) domain